MDSFCYVQVKLSIAYILNWFTFLIGFYIYTHFTQLRPYKAPKQE